MLPKIDVISMQIQQIDVISMQIQQITLFIQWSFTNNRVSLPRKQMARQSSVNAGVTLPEIRHRVQQHRMWQRYTMTEPLSLGFEEPASCH